MIEVNIREDCWLSSVLGCNVFQVDAGEIEKKHREDRGSIVDPIRSHIAGQSLAMYYTKVDSADVDLVRRLASEGFSAVDVNVTLGLDKSSSSDICAAGTRSVCSISEIGSEQHRDVLDIASSCFRYSRFHLDPLIPDEIANQVKREWVQNYILGKRGEQLFVASVDSRPAGFLAVLVAKVNGKKAGVIDLIGVGRQFQRRGIGQALVDHFFAEYRGKVDSFFVGTQIANTPSLRMYQKLGFSIIKAAYVMHLHVRAGTVVDRPHRQQSCILPQLG